MTEWLLTIYYNISHPLEWFLITFNGKNYFQIMGIILFDLWLWIPFTYFIFKNVILHVYMEVIQHRYMHTVPYVLLAIDVPKKNEQAIQAMEQVFVVIQGMHFDANVYEKYILGMFQLPFSCEIVSIDGYIQLLLRIPKAWRDVVESAIYGQYPDAEITEVNDYVNSVPSQWPNNTHDMWGVEWTYDNAKNPFAPIKTYKDFQDQFSQIFVDPLAGLLEAMSKIGKGEQIWVHFVCKILPVSWSKQGVEYLNQKLGRPGPSHSSSMLSKLTDLPAVIVNEFSQSILGNKILPVSGGKDAPKEDGFGKMFKMSPGERAELEAMEQKMGRLGYGVKMRYGYFAENGKSQKPRGVNAIIGAVKQFNAVGRQGLKPEMKRTATKASYFRVKQRKAYKQRVMVAALKRRSTHIGVPAMTMDTSELATLFHFPSMEIRVPMLKRTELVKAESPLNLPFEDHPAFQDLATKKRTLIDQPFAVPDPHAAHGDDHGHDSHGHDAHGATAHGHEAPHHPPELPWGETQAPGHDPHDHADEHKEHIATTATFDYDSDYFEEKFAVDKKAFAASRPERAELLREIVKEESLEQKSEVKKQESVRANEQIIDSTNQEIIESRNQENTLTPSSSEQVDDAELSKLFDEVFNPDAYEVSVVDTHEGYKAKTRERKYLPKTEQKNVEPDEVVPPNLPFV